jgi:hypothetical protein
MALLDLSRRLVTVSRATKSPIKFINFKSLKVHHYMFRPMLSSSGVKIFGEETAVLLLPILLDFNT